jgi:Protein of unknown function (DUF3558)
MTTVRRIAAGTAVAAALLAGCTSNGGDQAGPSPSGGSTAAAPTTAPATTQTASRPPSGAGGETEGAQPQACTLVTAEDAKAALGTAVGPGRSQQLGVYTGCTFTAADNSGSTATVQVLRSGATASAFDQIISGQGNAAVHVVPGIGDKAVQVSSILLFHKGSTVVTVLVVARGKTPAANASAEVTLAKQVAGRI